MNRNLLLIVAGMVLGVSLFSGLSLAVCPEDPNDNGECDTMYVEIYPDDRIFNPDVGQARFPIRVTHDLPDADIDSITSFVIPLCYTSSNPNAQCWIDPWYNATDFLVLDWDRLIFRHLPDCETAIDTNWMLHQFEQLDGREWDTRILDLGDEHFWLALFRTGSRDQQFWEGSRVLLATMTFSMEDTTTICIDTCYWPPASNLTFGRSDAVLYVPRHLMPVCEPITLIGPPPSFTVCPVDQSHSANGSFVCDFEVSDPGGEVIYVDAGLTGSGLTNVDVEYSTPPPAPVVQGMVVYDVIDHCQPGGIITVTGWDDLGQQCNCYFEVVLTNDPPAISLPESWLALSGYTMILKVPADDANGDAITGTDLVAMWFQADSLQIPTSPPSFDGGNPGTFTWVPAEADIGTWICQFSATDACRYLGTHQMSIQVGIPFCGDGTGDGSINVDDVVYLLGYLFRQGPAPDPLCRGDANCDGTPDAADMVYLINYFFRYGPAPCFDCCP